MKAWNVIWKIIVALAAIAGAIFVIATYGSKIVDWAKSVIGCGKKDDNCVDGECTETEESTDAAETTDAAPEAEATEAPVEDAVVAEEKDFEG